MSNQLAILNVVLLPYLLTHSLTSWSQIFVEKITGFQPVKKFPTFYGTQRFITTFTSASHISLSWASLIQTMPPHPTSWRFILILPSHLRLSLPSSLFPSVLPTQTIYKPLLSPIHTKCSADLILLNFITRTIMGKAYRSLSSSLCRFLNSPVISSLLGQTLLTIYIYIYMYMCVCVCVFCFIYISWRMGLKLCFLSGLPLELEGFACQELSLV